MVDGDVANRLNREFAEAWKRCFGCDPFPARTIMADETSVCPQCLMFYRYQDNHWHCPRCKKSNSAMIFSDLNQEDQRECERRDKEFPRVSSSKGIS